MKKILLIASFLTASAALACPNLSGSYRCVDTDSEGNQTMSEISITQNGNRFIYRDSEGPTELIADGSTVAIDGGVMRTSCNMSELVIELSADLVSDEGYPYHLASYTSVTKTGINLSMDTISEITFNGQVYREGESSHCTQL